MSEFVKMLKDIVRDRDAYYLMQQALSRQELHSLTSLAPDDIVTDVLVKSLGKDNNISTMKENFAKKVSENLALRNHPILIENPEYSTRILLKFCCALSMSGIMPGKYKQFKDIGKGMGCTLSISNKSGSSNNGVSANNNGVSFSNNKVSSSNKRISYRQNAIGAANNVGSAGANISTLYNSIMALNVRSNGKSDALSELVSLIQYTKPGGFDKIRPMVDKMQDILYNAYVKIFRDTGSGADPSGIPIQFEQLLSRYSGVSEGNVRLSLSNFWDERGVHEKTLDHMNKILKGDVPSNSINANLLLSAYQIISLYRRYAQKKYNLFLGGGRGYGGRINIRSRYNDTSNMSSVNRNRGNMFKINNSSTSIINRKSSNSKLNNNSKNVSLFNDNISRT